MGFKYFLKHIFKLIILFVSLVLCSMFTMGDGDLMVGIFLFILLGVNVSSTYDLGDGWFLKVTTGAGLGGALIGALLVSLALTWVETNIHIVMGIILLAYVINQIIETVRYFNALPKFFAITGVFCIVMFAIEMFRVFGKKPSFLLSFSYEGSEGFITVLLLFLTATLTLVNIIARATQAYYVED